MDRYDNYSFTKYENEYERQVSRPNIFYEIEEIEETISDKEEQLCELEAEIRQIARELSDLKNSLSRLSGK